MMQALVAKERIQNFLLLRELDPNNVVKINLSETNEMKQNKENIPAISVVNGTFTWSEQKTILRNINFVAFPRQLVAVIGRVGSGKSSLLSAILGDMDKSSGHVVVSDSIAYVPQQAWMRNATVRENILFGKVMVFSLR